MTGSAKDVAFHACGQALGNGAGLAVEKLQPGKAIEPIDTSLLIVQLAPGCAHGADLTIAPAKIIRILSTIRATDGKPVAIEIEYPGDSDPRFHGTLTVNQDDRILGVIPICACAWATTTTGIRSLFSPGN